LKLKSLRTTLHVGYSGHRPLWNITIERWCRIKRCSNHSITRIQHTTTKKKRQRTNTKRKKKIGN